MLNYTPLPGVVWPEELNKNPIHNFQDLVKNGDSEYIKICDSIIKLMESFISLTVAL